MRRKLPSNSALLAFEAAARHGSFVRAASELALTEGAISRQIGRLESFLDVTLFERIGNRVRLLPAGQRYARQVREILDRLEHESQSLRGQSRDSIALDIASLPTFACRWLIPRLLRFQRQNPHITIHLAERLEPFVLAGSGFDAFIHYVHPAWQGAHAYPLWQELLTPVCHPELLENQPSPALDELPRLHRRQNLDAWQRYGEETGIHLTHPAVGARYELHAMLLEAALAGLGVALVPRLYVEADIQQGRLVAPWPEGQTVGKTFCLVLPQALELSAPPLRAFAQWILEEAKAANAPQALADSMTTVLT